MNPVDQRRYEFVADLPGTTELLECANLMDTADRDLQRADAFRDTDVFEGYELPLGAETRFKAAVQHLRRIEAAGDIDMVPVLEWLVFATGDRPEDMTTEDVMRALHRERRLMRSNADPDRPGGRPSKVDDLVTSIEYYLRQAQRAALETQRDESQNEARDRLIRRAVVNADISRATYYRLRRRVLTEHDLDLNELDGFPKRAYS